MAGEAGKEGSSAVTAGPGGSVAAQATADPAREDAPEAEESSASKPAHQQAGSWGIGAAIGSVIGSAAGRPYIRVLVY